ncbi:MAG: glutamine amidotransferase-related protein [Geminicoccaceae bacterium]
MLGERVHFRPEEYRSLCPTGLEKDWILEWHAASAARSGLRLASVDICRGDRLPEVDDIDRVILGGTMHVVTEDRQWLHDLTGWLYDYRRTQRPLLAICGGHQLLATTFADGELTGRPDGTLSGTYEIELTADGRAHPLFRGLAETPRFHFANYLHVLPAETATMTVLATQPGSPAIALDHGGNWFSCQFHPESRKQSWDIYYSALDTSYTSAYAEDHDGERLIANFLHFQAQGTTAIWTAQQR